MPVDASSIRTQRGRWSCASEIAACLEGRILEAVTNEVDQVIVVVHQHPGRANRPVVLSAVLRRGVPALDDRRAVATFWQLIVIAEPRSPNHGAAGRHRRLLVLRGEHVGADLALQLLEALERFEFRVQGLARATLMKFVFPDRDNFVRLRDGREAEDLPAPRFHEVAAEVIQVDALHDDDNDALFACCRAGSSMYSRPID